MGLRISQEYFLPKILSMVSHFERYSCRETTVSWAKSRYNLKQVTEIMSVCITVMCLGSIALDSNTCRPWVIRKIVC